MIIMWQKQKYICTDNKTTKRIANTDKKNQSVGVILSLQKSRCFDKTPP